MGRADEVRRRPCGFLSGSANDDGLSSVKDEAFASLDDSGTSAERVLDLFDALLLDDVVP